MTPPRVRATAPVRVLDAGGWSDTWFARGGMVCHLAVGPGVEVVVERTDGPPGIVTLSSLGQQFEFTLTAPPGRDPLVEAVVRKWAPGDTALTITLTSSVPPGSSLGTSASAAVALITALTELRTERTDLDAVARAAHDIETVELGLQSGVQDQVAAARGGCNLVTIDPYPNVEVAGLLVAEETWLELSRRLVTVYLGTPHRSSAVHEAVIRRLTFSDPQRLLQPLRECAQQASDAIMAGDLAAYGAAMTANTAAQEELHPGLVGAEAHKVIEIARGSGAAGWKVNGAGGDGGTVTIVGPPDPAELVSRIAAVDGWMIVAVQPQREGVRIVDPT